MTSKERREKGLLFIADEAVWEEMKRARRLTQELNTADRWDFDKIRAIVNELSENPMTRPLSILPFTVITVPISRWAKTALSIITA